MISLYFAIFLMQHWGERFKPEKKPADWPAVNPPYTFQPKGAAMFKIFFVTVCITLTLGNVKMLRAEECQTIQDGTIYSSTGEVLETGFNDWGYNYQSHIFNGGYCDAYNDAEWCQPYADIELVMKWNEAWLSNKDCDDDGALDRHYGYVSYTGSGAWLTNHQKGMYIDEDGKKQCWNYFVKIVAVPSDAYSDGTFWYAADGTIIGPVIWGEFSIIQEVYNDTGDGLPNGNQYLSPFSVGFGQYSPKN